MTILSRSHFSLILMLLSSLCYISCGEQKTKTVPNGANNSLIDDGTGVLFKRNNIVIADIDRALKIYRDILGFTVFGEIEESGEDSYSYPVFKIPKEAKIRFVTLNSKSQERTIAFTEVKGIEIPRPSNSPHTSGVVIRVDDLKNVMKQLKELDLESTKMKEVRSSRINYREQAFVDYDGHLVVLYETF